MRLMRPAKTTGSNNKNIVMDRIRRFRDELNEDILEDRPGNWYNPEGLTEYESVPDEDEDGISDELENGDSSDERVDMSDQEEQEADISDQEKGTEDEEQILEDTKSQQSDDSEFDDSVTNLLFDLENESSKLFTSSAINEGDDTSPHFEPPTFLETTEKVIGDDRSVAFADTNKQDEPDSTLHLHDFHKLLAANKPGAEADRIESQTETIVTNKSSPDTLKIDGNMIEEANVQPDKSTKEKEAEPKNTLNKDKIHDTQPKCVSSQEEAAVFDDIPSKKRKAADRPSTKVKEIQSVLSSQHKSYIEPSKQDVTTVLDDPAPNKRMKND
ncbi:MAG: RNA-binding domain-containing protein [Aureobasidium pullulans]|nr:MAG: RNA-binding domain-containing protein [Aureobasidium pullulans]